VKAVKIRCGLCTRMAPSESPPISNAGTRIYISEMEIGLNIMSAFSHASPDAEMSFLGL
jgi:hypothetical protein